MLSFKFQSPSFKIDDLCQKECVSVRVCECVSVWVCVWRTLGFHELASLGGQLKIWMCHCISDSIFNWVFINPTRHIVGETMCILCRGIKKNWMKINLLWHHFTNSLWGLKCLQSPTALTIPSNDKPEADNQLWEQSTNLVRLDIVNIDNTFSNIVIKGYILTCPSGVNMVNK